ncbi:hypothetical protein ACFXP7_12765 [Microbacterium sp. P06]|uniref:hypothetical protein n=1 Tax=unclassified Microbacterium TaxID=2609290 RepID=UPI00374590CE
MVADLLHAGALGATGLGTCCVALDRPRPRLRELSLSIVMFLAMLDVITGAHLVPVVGWSAVTTALAMALGARRRRSAEPPAVSGMRVHAAIGAILMAGLMLAMSGGLVVDTGSHHGASAVSLVLLLVAATGVYAAWSATRLRHAHLLERVQYVSMAVSLLLLAGAVAA